MSIILSKSSLILNQWKFPDNWQSAGNVEVGQVSITITLMVTIKKKITVIYYKYDTVMSTIKCISAGNSPSIVQNVTTGHADKNSWPGKYKMLHEDIKMLVDNNIMSYLVACL